MRLRGRSLASLSGLRIPSGISLSCGVGCRCGSDPALVWFWRRPVAAALIRPLAWESPCAAGAALEKAKTHTHTNVYSVPLSIFWGRGKCWAGSMQNPPGQGLNPCHSRDTTRSLTARPPGNSYKWTFKSSSNNIKKVKINRFT